MLLQKNQKFSIRRDASFGDQLIATLMVHVLNDNGIKSYYESRVRNRTAIFWGGCTYIEKLVNCPFSKESKEDLVTHWLTPNEENAKKNPDKTILQDLIEQFKIKNKIKNDIKINRKYVPVNFKRINYFPKFDISICSKVGKFSTHKQWPYFQDLKKILEIKKLKYIDLNENNIIDNECLNCVNNSKLYLGMDTGTSHYVSMVTNKSLIIQSGVTSAAWWNLYNYNVIENKVICSPCFLKTNQRCLYNNICTQIKATEVMDKIESLL